MSSQVVAETTTYTHYSDIQHGRSSITVGTTTCPAASTTSNTPFLVYDGDRQLVARQAANASGALLAKQVNGVTATRYVAGGLYEVDAATGATKKSYRFGGRLVALRDSSTGPHYLHQDHLGSTSLQTSAAGAYEGHEFRDPFGQPWQSGGSFATDLKYTDQRSFESNLGSLYDYGSRFYSPVLGRFLQPDTLIPNFADPQSLNRYSYTLNNPLRYTDPSGHSEDPTPPGRRVGDKWEGYGFGSDGSYWHGWYEHAAWGDQFVGYDLISGPPDEGDHALGGLADLSKEVLSGAAPDVAKRLQQAIEESCLSPASFKKCFGYQAIGDLLVPHPLMDCTPLCPGGEGGGGASAIAGKESGSTSSSGLEAASDAAGRAANRVGEFAVPAKHLPTAAGRWAKFAPGVDTGKAIREALTSDSAVFLPNRIPDSYVVETSLGRTVGTKGETAIRVVFGDDGKIWTAFPVK